MPTEEQDIGSMYGSQKTSTFLGLPSCPDLNTLDADIAVLGAGCATPYTSVGAYCAEAPAAIRAMMARYSATLSHHDFDLGGPLLGPGNKRAVDCGDLPFDEADPAGNRERIRTAISTMLDRGATPVVLGGDDSVPIPIFQAFEGRGRFTILQLDAHIDFREEVNGERWGLSSTMRRASELGCIERIIQVGQRGVGSARPADYEAALARGVRFIPARALHAKGVAQVLDLVPPGSNVLITLDCDALDPSVMPAVIGRAPGGLSYWQVLELIEGIAERGRIAAFDLVEFMPARDVAGQGALVAGRIVAHVIGLLSRS
ncbi:agmatinase [Rhizobiales bacterium GAS191]|jgi:agmatinase|nr:agmatinase [Rhizobiales bacterium GAS113]SED36030.1 agmatinase [Rhizobiales bacterium GAS188]SEE95564.1 agmatinase [Rhizobiales bacterium GAS191]